MRIIREGTKEKLEHQCTCKKCSCIFVAAETEGVVTSYPDDPDKRVYFEVICPSCNEHLQIDISPTPPKDKGFQRP